MTGPLDDAARARAGEIYRAESRRVLATLIRLLGDCELAEEALHDAFTAALEQWPRQGVPAEPRAWLDPWVSLAAQEFRRGQRHNVSRLSQLGCQVALVRPALAEERVARLYESIKRRRQL